MSPRKSSTSSGRPRRPRPRYLGLEVAGEPLPTPSTARWTARLQSALGAAGASVPFRVIRSDGGGAIVEVEALNVPAARRAWNVPGAGALRTTRSWGTLVGAKTWLARRERPANPGGPGR